MHALLSPSCARSYRRHQSCRHAPPPPLLALFDAVAVVGLDWTTTDVFVLCWHMKNVPKFLSMQDSLVMSLMKDQSFDRSAGPEEVPGLCKQQVGPDASRTLVKWYRSLEKNLCARSGWLGRRKQTAELKKDFRPTQENSRLRRRDGTYVAGKPECQPVVKQWISPRPSISPSLKPASRTAEADAAS